MFFSQDNIEILSQQIIEKIILINNSYEIKIKFYLADRLVSGAHVEFQMKRICNTLFNQYFSQ
jgi:hypothetical protein